MFEELVWTPPEPVSNDRRPEPSRIEATDRPGAYLSKAAGEFAAGRVRRPVASFRGGEPISWNNSERIVEGYASLPFPDEDDDIIPLKEIKDALPGFMKHRRHLGEMHEWKVGKVLAAVVDEHGLRIKARVDDPEAWSLVKDGTYRGLSLGGKAYTEPRWGGGQVLSKIKLHEISLVDRPANPYARISVIKSFAKSSGGRTQLIWRTTGAPSPISRGLCCWNNSGNPQPYG
jgi:HK97 family phage prohead protease